MCFPIHFNRFFFCKIMLFMALFKLCSNRTIAFGAAFLGGGGGGNINFSEEQKQVVSPPPPQVLPD